MRKLSASYLPSIHNKRDLQAILKREGIPRRSITMDETWNNSNTVEIKESINTVDSSRHIDAGERYVYRSRTVMVAVPEDANAIIHIDYLNRTTSSRTCIHYSRLLGPLDVVLERKLHLFMERGIYCI